MVVNLAKFELLRYAGGVLALVESQLQLQLRWLTATIASECAGAVWRPALGLFQVEHPGASRVARGNKYHSVVCQLRYRRQPEAHNSNVIISEPIIHPLS
jgi:hypothetical protein